MLARSPGGGQGRRAKAFAGAGLGVSVAPGPALTTAWGAYIPKGVAELRAAFQFRDLVFDGWGYQEPGVGEASASDRVRAAVALGGWRPWERPKRCMSTPRGTPTVSC